MNLNAVYELKAGMEMAVIAGVNLIQEDFRLKRAVEQMAPLVAVSPVFKKIYGSSQKLVSEMCEDREGCLLDTLALIDAVCATQGSLQEGGEIFWDEELEMTADGSRFGAEARTPQGNGGWKNVPYSVMAPVMEAFRGTGGGRYAIIRDAHEVSPELFDDYRVEALMVQALGDSYAELADMVEQWLEEKGTRILPLLKQGFDPEGKREMARRIHVLDAVAAGRENEFYCNLLKEANSQKGEISKEVKEAAIRALRHEEGNEPFLLDLLKTEAGKMKEQVLYALSFMNGDDSREYWSQAMKKKPSQTAAYLANTTEDWASDLIADALGQWLESYKEHAKGTEPEEDGQDNTKASQANNSGGSGLAGQAGKKKKTVSGEKEEKEKRRQELLAIWYAAAGKHSEKLCQYYEAIYRLIPEDVPEVLIRSLIEEPHPSLCQVAKTMYQNHREAFAESYGVMVLLTEPKEKAYEELSPYFKPGFWEKLTGKKKEADGIFAALERVEYIEGKGFYQVNTIRSGPVYREAGTKHQLKEELDLRWYSILLNSPLRYEGKWKHNFSVYKNRYDAMVARLYRPDMENLKKEYGAYFYDKAMKQEVTVEGLRLMKRCGWTEYKGLLAAEAARNKNVAVYMIRQLVEELPLSNVELAKELDGYIKMSRTKAVNGIALLEKWRDELRDGQTPDRL